MQILIVDLESAAEVCDARNDAIIKICLVIKNILRNQKVSYKFVTDQLHKLLIKCEETYSRQLPIQREEKF